MKRIKITLAYLEMLFWDCLAGIAEPHNYKKFRNESRVLLKLAKKTYLK